MKAGKWHCFLLVIGSGIKRKLPSILLSWCCWAISILFLKRVCFQKTTEACFSLVVGVSCVCFTDDIFKINTSFLIFSFQQLQEAKSSKFYISGKNIFHFYSKQCFSTRWKLTSRDTKSACLPMAMMISNWMLWKGVRIRSAVVKQAAKLSVFLEMTLFHFILMAVCFSICIW